MRLTGARVGEPDSEALVGLKGVVVLDEYVELLLRTVASFAIDGCRTEVASAEGYRGGQRLVVRGLGGGAVGGCYGCVEGEAAFRPLVLGGGGDGSESNGPGRAGDRSLFDDERCLLPAQDYGDVVVIGDGNGRRGGGALQMGEAGVRVGNGRREALVGFVVGVVYYVQGELFDSTVTQQAVDGCLAEVVAVESRRGV